VAVVSYASLEYSYCLTYLLIDSQLSVLPCLQQDLAALSEQVDKTTSMYQTLLHEFPDASDHMTAKQDELISEWNSLLVKARTRTERLNEAESIQMYFDDYRGLW